MLLLPKTFVEEDEDFRRQPFLQLIQQFFRPDEVSWGNGEDFGTMTFRCDSDHGLLPLFRLSSNGKINLQLNFLRSKNLHKQVLDDMVIKFESNFLREYDEDSYPSDSYEPIEDLICTHNQLETFMRTIEGCTYRLKQ
jgi:hypothetical protein